jgi:CheY-like chemotaxis protein
MDGIEAVWVIRNEIGSEYARSVPIVALTANALKGNEEMFLSHGFNAYIAKPIDIFQLDVVLNTWIRNKQIRKTPDQAEPEKAAERENHRSASPDIFDGLSVAGLDLAAGKKQYNNAAFLEIIRSYCVHTPALLDKIRDFSEEKLDQYTIAVHGLKGSSYNICANEVGNCAAALEAAARKGDSGTIKAKNGWLIKTAETLISSLNELLVKNEKNKNKKQPAAVPDPHLLDKLLAASKQYRSALMEEAIVELERYEYDSGGDLVLWLREQLDNLEYDAIQDRLENQDSLSKTTETIIHLQEQEGN